MDCACTSRQPDAKVLLKHMESIGWHTFSESAIVDFPDVVSQSHRELLKAERAEALGLGEQVVSVHRRAAERHNRHALQLTQSIRQGLRERVEQEDWKGRAASLTDIFSKSDGGIWLRDFRESCVEALYKADISGEDAAEAIRVVDDVLGVGRQGLDAVASFLDSSFAQAEKWLQAPRMGLEARSPLSEAAVACIVAATGAAAGSVFACLALGPFAPACIIAVVGIATAIIVFGCLTL